MSTLHHLRIITQKELKRIATTVISTTPSRPTFSPSFQQSKAWATIKSHIMYALRSKYIQPIFVRGVRFFDDGLLLRFIGLIEKQSLALATTNPRLCISMLKGEPLGDLRLHLPQSLISEELSLLEAAIRAEKTTIGSTLSAQQQDETMQAVVSALILQEGANSVALLDVTKDATGREREVCNSLGAFYHQVAALPLETRSPFMRTLLSGGQ